jgi:signal transduction histidine kinase/FixJ family two-component response regulator
MFSAIQEPVFIIHTDRQVSFLLERIVKSAGLTTIAFFNWATAQSQLEKLQPALVIIGDQLADATGLECCRVMMARMPMTPLILMVTQDTPELLRQAMHLGVTHYLRMPLRSEDVSVAVQESMELGIQRRAWLNQRSAPSGASLEREVKELGVLGRLGRSITHSLNIESVLTAIVEAAVELTNSEEGSLLMLDDVTGELYIRASRNFSDEFVRTFHMRAEDSLAGSVISSGKPFILNMHTPQKIKTAYLVHSLVYVPLTLDGKTFGVLGVDNRTVRLAFTERDIELLQALAEYAVVALENARLYTEVVLERNKAQAILANIRDGVIVLDENDQVLFANQVVFTAYQLPENMTFPRPLVELIDAQELHTLLTTSQALALEQVELVSPGGRIFGMQLTPITGVGKVITLHDITYLKRMDKLKSEFVNTVSHDLRSPLTAILGYVELIERAGAVTDSQRDYIRRVQSSVMNITALVNDLLNLGRIEAGFDQRRETVNLHQIVNYAVDNLRLSSTNKNISVVTELADNLPPLFINPIQIRQMLNNLLDNAIKYTTEGGKVIVRVMQRENQMILQVQDTGVGIPQEELPFIFDKFFRGSKTAANVAGTGLGLAIVKSVVDSHQGRIWVDSNLEQGTCFTVVFPMVKMS